MFFAPQWDMFPTSALDVEFGGGTNELMNIAVD
jgi:hypothetical protein